MHSNILMQIAPEFTAFYARFPEILEMNWFIEFICPETTFRRIGGEWLI